MQKIHAYMICKRFEDNVVHIYQLIYFNKTHDVKGHEKGPKRSKWSNYGTEIKLADSPPACSGQFTYLMRRLKDFH